MAIFKMGDLVVESGRGSLGNKGKVGRIMWAQTRPFTFYNVKFPGDSETYEYHKGELKRYKP